MTPMNVPLLSLLETRVLGTLIEKERTVPDIYPLSLNALVSGCTQKTSRHPAMEATDPDVQAALDNLTRYHLVLDTRSFCRSARAVWERSIGHTMRA